MKRHTLASTRREIRLLELHLTRWPTSPRLKRRLVEEHARLGRLKASLRSKIYGRLKEVDETTLEILAEQLGVAS